MPELGTFPNGTIVKHCKKLYCVQYGLEGRIVVDVSTGIWHFIRDLNWKQFEVLFNPYSSNK